MPQLALDDSEHAELYRMCQEHSSRAYELVRRLASYGLIPDPEPHTYGAGDLVIWDAGGNWGQVPATVLCLSRSGNRVRIRCKPPREKYDHYAYVTRAKLSHQTPCNHSGESK